MRPSLAVHGNNVGEVHNKHMSKRRAECGWKNVAAASWVYCQLIGSSKLAVYLSWWMIKIPDSIIDFYPSPRKEGSRQQNKYVRLICSVDDTT